MSLNHRLDKIMQTKLELWLVLLMLLLLTLGGLALSWATFNIENLRNKNPFISSVIDSIFQRLNSFVESAEKIKTVGYVSNQIFKTLEPTGFIVNDNNAKKGYILLSAFDVKNNVSSIFLYSLGTLEKIHTWVPDVKKILSNTSPDYTPTNQDYLENFRSQHPLLLDDGGLLISSGHGLLVRLNKDSSIKWHIERQFHHSIEKGINDNTFISQIRINKPVILSNMKELAPIQNDGYVIFSGNGKILEERSVAQILIDNGYTGLLFGTKWESDRIHLNDAEFIRESEEFVKKGDIMFSCRHLSTVFLYRPSINKVIWLKQGPFLNQHDIDYLGDGKFSILGNDNIRFGSDGRLVHKYSSIYEYNMANDEVTKTLNLEEAKVNIGSSGRLQKINNDLFFIDAITKVLIVDKNGKILLSYAHPAGDDSIGTTHWSRYLESVNTKNF